MDYELSSMFGIKDKVVAVTGGGGILCGEMCRALGKLGAKIAVLDLSEEAAGKVADGINKDGGTAMAAKCNVLETDSIAAANEAIVKELGAPEYLINGAGGNSKDSTSGGETFADQIDPSFFDMKQEAFGFVFNLNFMGTLLPTQVFAKSMVEKKSGCVINVSSMSGYLPLTKVAGYSAAKAAIENFTRWLAVHFASTNIRVNAIAPGFLLTEQNRFLLTDEKTGEPTARGHKIINNTPMGRYGEPSELIGAILYLMSPAASFVTGTSMPIDGGFAAFSGV